MTKKGVPSGRLTMVGVLAENDHFDPLEVGQLKRVEDLCARGIDNSMLAFFLVQEITQ